MADRNIPDHHITTSPHHHTTRCAIAYLPITVVSFLRHSSRGTPSLVSSEIS
jgi:hypothetical protein